VVYERARARTHTHTHTLGALVLMLDRVVYERECARKPTHIHAHTYTHTHTQPFLGTLLAPFVSRLPRDPNGDRWNSQGMEDDGCKSAVASRTPASPTWGLEVFAREVREAWTSVGDECLLFQNLRHMQASARTEPGLV